MNRMEDSTEFLISLLMRLNTEDLHGLGMTFSQENRYTASPIFQIFGSTSYVIAECTKCKLQEWSEGLEAYISPLVLKKNVKTVLEALDTFLCENTYTASCRNCLKETLKVERRQISKSAKFILLQLGRFTDTNRKNKCLIAISKNITFGDMKYEFVGGILHEGNSVHSGHYTAICRYGVDPNRWTHYNDSVRKPVDNINCFLKDKSTKRNLYLLAYVQVPSSPQSSQHEDSASEESCNSSCSSEPDLTPSEGPTPPSKTTRDPSPHCTPEKIPPTNVSPRKDHTPDLTQNGHPPPSTPSQCVAANNCFLSLPLQDFIPSPVAFVEVLTSNTPVSTSALPWKITPSSKYVNTPKHEATPDNTQDSSNKKVTAGTPRTVPSDDSQPSKKRRFEALNGVPDQNCDMPRKLKSRRRLLLEESHSRERTIEDIKKNLLDTEQFIATQMEEIKKGKPNYASIATQVEFPRYSYEILCDTKHFKFLTGLDIKKFEVLYAFIGGDSVCSKLKKKYSDKTPQKCRPGARKLSLKSCLFLVLMRLRRGYTYDDIAIMMGISTSYAGVIFYSWIRHIYLTFKAIRPIMAASAYRQDIEKPPIFKPFGNLRMVVDSCEIKIERPSDLLQQGNTHSRYKAHNTMKFLIGSSCSGAICYVSDGFEGRISDKKLFKCCGILDLLDEGDVLMADRGFRIEDLVENRGITLLKPSDLGKKRPHLTGSEEVTHKVIASARIFVEHCVGRIKEWRLLRNVMEIHLLPIVSDTVYVIACLSNFQTPYVGRSKEEEKKK